jgi:hypothetical protein
MIMDPDRPKNFGTHTLSNILNEHIFLPKGNINWLL